MTRNQESIKFKPSITSIYQCLILLCFSWGALAFPFTIDVQLNSIIFYLALIPCSIAAIMGLSKILVKKLFIKNGILYFKNGIFTYKLNIEKSRIYYEKVFVWGGNFKDYYGLVLHVNIDNLTRISLNNKFVLTYEMNEIKLAYYKKEFQSKLGIEINSVGNLW